MLVAAGGGRRPLLVGRAPPTSSYQLLSSYYYYGKEAATDTTDSSLFTSRREARRKEACRRPAGSNHLCRGKLPAVPASTEPSGCCWLAGSGGSREQRAAAARGARAQLPIPRCPWAARELFLSRRRRPERCISAPCPRPSRRSGPPPPQTLALLRTAACRQQHACVRSLDVPSHPSGSQLRRQRLRFPGLRLARLLLLLGSFLPRAVLQQHGRFRNSLPAEALPPAAVPGL